MDNSQKKKLKTLNQNIFWVRSSIRNQEEHFETKQVHYSVTKQDHFS